MCVAGTRGGCAVSLSFADIGYTYGAGTSFECAALAGVSFEVGRGELVLVLGATGSGKSTLLRVACGLLDASTGTATLDGVAIAPDVARGRVGLVFQDAEAQLFADTVLDDVAFGPRNMGATTAEAQRAAGDALAMVGLDPATFAARSPFSLSGGEARRAAIAGVIAMRPDYLLADEPTSGLDARGRRLVRALIARQRETSGVVIVSHLPEEFLGEADRVLVLEGGRPVWYGDAAELIADPSLFREAGLEAPDVLEVQRCFAAKTGWSGAFALDPVEAASRLLAARGCAR